MKNPTKEKILGEFELDSTAHSQGRCSFSLTSLCIAEEQKVKSFLSQKLDEYAYEMVKTCLPEEKKEGGGIYGHPEIDFNTGFNSARIQMLERSKEILDIK